jgi:DNA-binding PadR family transcriptional regulator
METLTNSELAILGLLAESPAHGYQIEQDIAARGYREWTEIGFSSIYYALNRLEGAGWLESSVEADPAPPGARNPPSKRSGPARRIYHLTPAGWQVYRAGVRERLAHPRPRSGDFDLALASLPALPPAEARAALEACRAGLRERLAHVRARWEQDRAARPLPPHVEALFDHAAAGLSAELAWVEKFLEDWDGSTGLEERRENAVFPPG